MVDEVMDIFLNGVEQVSKGDYNVHTNVVDRVSGDLVVGLRALEIQFSYGIIEDWSELVEKLRGAAK